MKDNFLKAYHEFFPSVEGAFQFDAALMFMAYNQIIASHGVTGDVLEIGVLHGLSSIAVAALRGKEKQFVAIDLFDDLQSENVSRSGFGNRASFQRNLETFYPNTEFMRVIHGNSADLEPRDLGRNFSFCHIDGGHSDDETYHDLQLCHEILLPGGLLALDDYFNPSYPGVSEGAFRFQLDHPGALNPIAIGFNKVLFQKPGPSESVNAMFARLFSPIPKVSTCLWKVEVNLFWSQFLYFFDLELSTPQRLVGRTDKDIRATYEPEASELRAKPGAVVNLPVKVTNNSTIPFQCGDNTFGLSYHLLSSNGVMLRQDNARNFFKAPLQPGEQEIIQLAVFAPDKHGEYLVEIDLVWEGVMWFKDKGNPTCIVPLQVSD